MARSQRRAQAVARLRHPNLVRLLPLPGGAGLSPVLGNARRLADFTLPAGTFKRFDLEQVVRLLLDVLSGLSVLHEVVTDGQPFVHGQVSPETIYIDEYGTARLVPLLYGSKVEVVGYRAPERLAGGAVDARADVFSVGVMLWEALAGKRLFPKGMAAQALAAPPPIHLSPDARWAQPLCAIAERAIALQPAARFASAVEFSNALAAAAAQQLSHVDTAAWQDEAPTPVFQPKLHLLPARSTTPPPSVVTLVPESTSAVTATTEASEITEPSFVAPRRSRAGRVAAVALGIGLLGLGAAALWFAPARLRARNTAPAPAAAPAPAPAPAPPRNVSPDGPVLSAAPISRPAVAAARPVAPAPSLSASASVPAPSASVKPAAKPASSPRTKRSAPGKLPGSDYGI
jgi:eukaryotic-like serine/threonine-protein kinase